jgi:protoheme IX farnesyltransferase
MKRWTVLNTLVGAVPGAIPPLLGFVAGRGNLGPEGWALFSILFLWQIPHFLAIAWRYRTDYRRVGFRMLPCSDEKGRVTGLVATLYCLVLLVVSLWPFALGAAGFWYLGGAIALGLAFLAVAARFSIQPTAETARQLFLTSVCYLPILLILLVVDRQ